MLALNEGSIFFSVEWAFDLHRSRGLDCAWGEGYEYEGETVQNVDSPPPTCLPRGLCVPLSSGMPIRLSGAVVKLLMIVSGRKPGLAKLLFTFSLFLRSRSNCIRVTLSWDFMSGLVSRSVASKIFGTEGSAFHLFMRESVSLSEEGVKEDQDSDFRLGARLFIERSMGEQLEMLSASLLSLVRLYSWLEYSLSDCRDEGRLRIPQSSSRCPFLVSRCWELWLLRRRSNRLLQFCGGRPCLSKGRLSLGGLVEGDASEGLEFNVGKGSVPFWMFKELNTSGVVGGCPMLGGLVSCVF